MIEESKKFVKSKVLLISRLDLASFFECQLPHNILVPYVSWELEWTFRKVQTHPRDDSVAWNQTEFAFVEPEMNMVYENQS